MNAYRCPECGDVRWSFLAVVGRKEKPTCEICGETMVPERRRPGSLRSLKRERREAEQGTAARPSA